MRLSTLCGLHRDTEQEELEKNLGRNKKQFRRDRKGFLGEIGKD
jgi:hypothetical protein